MEDLVSYMLQYYKGKNVLVTGHTGFKGTWLARTLLLAGAEVTGYSLDPPTSPSLFELTETDKAMKSVTGDVRDLGHLMSVFRETRPDIVFHLAAQPIVRQSYQNPVETFSTNILGTVNILEAVRQAGSVYSLVNVTTDKVYRNYEWLWGYRENEELCGYDPYSNSKSCSELVTYSYKQAFFNQESSAAVSTARSGNVIGGGDFAPDRIVPDCIRSVLGGTDLVLRNPQSTRPYQHVLECLSGYLLLAMRQGEDISLSGAFNFGPDEEGCVSTRELADSFFKAWGSGCWTVNTSEEGPHETNFLRLDCSKAKTLLGWKPQWHIQKAVEKTVEWLRGYQEGNDVGETVDTQVREYFKF